MFRELMRLCQHSRKAMTTVPARLLATASARHEFVSLGFSAFSSSTASVLVSPRLGFEVAFSESWRSLSERQDESGPRAKSEGLYHRQCRLWSR